MDAAYGVRYGHLILEVKTYRFWASYQKKVVRNLSRIGKAALDPVLVQEVLPRLSFPVTESSIELSVALEEFAGLLLSEFQQGCKSLAHCRVGIFAKDHSPTSGG